MSTFRLSKSNLTILGIAYFFVLFNYSMVRSVSTTFFYESYGAKAAPQGWLVAIVLLMLTVGFSNRLQAKLGMRWAFLIVTLITVVIFGGGAWAYSQGVPLGAFAMFSWKEVYIVLQVHLLLAYANSWMPRAEFIKWIGLIGAIGSIGGVVGGLVTSSFVRSMGPFNTLMLSQLAVLLPAVLGMFLHKIPGSEQISQSVGTPLASVKNPPVRGYVISIALMVALAQIVINIADLQFGLVFEKAITNPVERTAYLGSISTVMNGITLGLQLIVLPILLKFVSERSLHFFIPASYLVCLALGVGSEASALLASSFFYVYLKASDYSLFSAGRELLYHPLAPVQKYGAKYLTDMVAYRGAKALIAIFLIYFQTPGILMIITVAALLLWGGLVYGLFKQRQIIA